MCDGAILQAMILVTSLSLFEYFDTFNSSLVVVIAFILVIIPLMQFVAMNMFIYRQTIKENMKNIIDRFSDQEKGEPNNVIANSTAASNPMDLIIDDSTRKSRSSSICEMYVSTTHILIYYLPS